jgi:hypothetical protein
MKVDLFYFNRVLDGSGDKEILYTGLWKNNGVILFINIEGRVGLLLMSMIYDYDLTY